MGTRHRDELVYILDGDNAPHFVQHSYWADLGGCYRSDIYLKTKSYCVTDYLLSDEVEQEGTYLPCTTSEDWKTLLDTTPSSRAATIVSEAGLSHIPVSGVVFFSVSSSARTILDWEGFVSTPQGTRPIPPEVWQTALGWARLSADSVTGQLEILAEGILDWVRNDGTPARTAVLRKEEIP